MTSKVVNNRPTTCSTNGVGKVDGLDSLVPFPSFLFVKFCNQAKAVLLNFGPSGIELKSLLIFSHSSSQHGVYLRLRPRGLVSSAAKKQNSAKILVCLNKLGCTWKYANQQKGCTGTVPVSFAAVPLLHRLAGWGLHLVHVMSDGQCGDRGNFSRIYISF